MSVCAELSDAGWSESDTECRVTEAGDSGPSSSDRPSPLITAAGSPVRNQPIFLQDQVCFLGLPVRDCDSYIMLTCVPSNQLKWVDLSLFSVRGSSWCLATQFFLCTERLARQSWWQQAADIDSCKCTDNNFEHSHSQHPYLADASVETVLCKREKVL